MITDDRFDVPLLFNAPTSSAQWAYVGRIYDRAVKLFDDGYWFDKITVETLEVVTPNGGRYTVQLPEADCFAEPEAMWKCSCEGFNKDKDCKHRIAVALNRYAQEEKEGRERIQLAMLEEMDANAASAETANGCDYPDDI